MQTIFHKDLIVLPSSPPSPSREKEKKILQQSQGNKSECIDVPLWLKIHFKIFNLESGTLNNLLFQN